MKNQTEEINCYVCRHPGSYDKWAVKWLIDEKKLCDFHFQNYSEALNPREPGSDDE